MITVIDKLISDAFIAEQELDEIDRTQFEKLEQLEQTAQKQQDQIEQLKILRETIREQAEALLQQMKQTDKSLAEAKTFKFTQEDEDFAISIRIAKTPKKQADLEEADDEANDIERIAIQQLLQSEFTTKEQRIKLEQLETQRKINRKRQKELFEETDRIIAKAQKLLGSTDKKSRKAAKERAKKTIQIN